MPESQFNSLCDWISTVDTTNVLVTGMDDDEYVTAQRLGLHEDLATDFQLMVLNHRLFTGTEFEFVEYDPTYKPESDQILYLEFSNDDDIGIFVDVGSDVNGTEPFEEDRDFCQKLRFYSIVLEKDGNKATFFRKFTRTNELNSRKLYAVTLSRGNYKKLSKKVFLFDEKIDCFAWNNILYIYDKNSFQNIFDYFETVKKAAEVVVTELHNKFPVANFDQFKDFCVRNRRMMAKLISISKKDYLQTLTIDDLKRVSTSFSLDVEFDEQDQIVFNPSVKTRWQILNLFNDDYLKSELTDNKYEVNSKLEHN